MEYPEVEKRIRDLHEAIRRDDGSVPDEEAVRLVQELDEALAWRTNAENAAYLLFSAIAPVCAFRPHLEEKLLDLPLWAMMGWPGGSCGEYVSAWIAEYVRKEESPFGGIPAEGVEWLRRVAGEPQKIQALIDRIAEVATAEATKEAIERLAAHAAVPRERIDYRWEWSDALLQEHERAILFFEAPLGDETLRSFRALTEALSSLDPQRILKFVVLEVPPWKRPPEFRHELMADRWTDLGEAEPQTFWVFRGQVIGTAGLGMTDRVLFEEKTQELLRRGGPA